MCYFVVKFPLFPYIPGFVGVKIRGIKEKCRLLVLVRNSVITDKRCAPLCKYLEQFCKSVLMLLLKNMSLLKKKKN